LERARYEQLELFDPAEFTVRALAKVLYINTALTRIHYGEAEHDPFIDDLDPHALGPELPPDTAA